MHALLRLWKLVHNGGQIWFSLYEVIMKKLFVTLLLAFSSLANATQWNEGTTVGIPVGDAKNVGQIIVGSSGTQWPIMSIPANQWVQIDFANGPQWGSGDIWQPNLPADTNGIFLSGILIISHPGGGVICNLTVNFRAPGSQLSGWNYQMQTIEATSYAGVRSNAAVWVPMVDRKIEIYWTYTAGCPSMLNLSLQAYVR